MASNKDELWTKWSPSSNFQEGELQSKSISEKSFVQSSLVNLQSVMKYSGGSVATEKLSELPTSPCSRETISSPHDWQPIRWTREDFLRLRKNCSTIPQNLLCNFGASSKLLKAHASSPQECPEDTDYSQQDSTTNIEASSDYSAGVWRRKARFDDNSDRCLGKEDLGVKEGWRKKSGVESSTVVSEDWLMPFDGGDFVLGASQEEGEAFEVMRQKQRQTWAPTGDQELHDDSETGDGLQLIMDSVTENESNREEFLKNDAVQASCTSQQIDVQSLFTDGGPSGNASSASVATVSEAGSTQQHCHGTDTSSHGQVVGSYEALAPETPHQNTSLRLPMETDLFTALDQVVSARTSHPLTSNENAEGHSEQARDLPDGKDLKASERVNIWSSGGLGAGITTSETPAMDVDWKAMHDLWSRPVSRCNGVEDKLNGMHLGESWTGNSHHAMGNGVGNVPVMNAHYPMYNTSQSLESQGVASPIGFNEGSADINAMKYLMQPWQGSSDQSTRMPSQGGDFLRSQKEAFLLRRQQVQQQQSQIQFEGLTSGDLAAAENLYHLYNAQYRDQRLDNFGMYRHPNTQQRNISSEMALRSRQLSAQQSAMLHKKSIPQVLDATMNAQGQDNAKRWFQATMSHVAQNTRHQMLNNSAMQHDIYRGVQVPVSARSAIMLSQNAGIHTSVNSDHRATLAALQQQQQGAILSQVYGNSINSNVHAPSAQYLQSSQSHGSVSNIAHMPNYADTVARNFMTPLAPPRQPIQHYAQIQQAQISPYNNSGVALHRQPQHAVRHTVSQNGLPRAAVHGAAPHSFSRFVDAGAAHARR